ncbi:uncharacterized protein LOC142240107 [Haematobia irritans]|uniref:uncharacterized protein LOC142240107 n=1 Tax=Haematobia irritans TaxID=7368 RepID=UPI003F4FC7A1
MVISEENVLRTIKAAKSSTAIGPDGLATRMLKRIGENGVRFLTHTFNVCLNTPKYQTSGNILEAILLPYITEHLMLAEHQHGFHSGKSMTTALCVLTANIAEGLNSKRAHKRSILVALDLSKAFDTVNHNTLRGCYGNHPS